MQITSSYLALSLAATSLAHPTPAQPAINSTKLQNRDVGQNYYDLGINMPICVPTTGINLCTTTIAGTKTLPQAWVWLFDNNCDMWHFDSQADWGSLGAGTYQIPATHLDAPVTVHATQEVFMQNYIDDDFWVEKSQWRQSFNGNQAFLDNGWNGGESEQIYEIKRMNWMCTEGGIEFIIPVNA